ncbi:MAG: S1 RNA-binding domain-containing protein, partial [Bacteroidales bacterium]|nr:S1 RNA-binding domain-containing protein [Bacteroidales bacterium]
VFVELEEGVDGLIHISDLSWSKKVKHPAEFTKIGEKIELVVLDIDVENRRLSLGHKQLEENPWEVFETIFTVDSIHQGTVLSTNEKGAIIVLPYGVEGFAPGKHLVKEDGTSAKVDETLDFKVIEFSKDAKKIIVSHTKTRQIEEAAQEKPKEPAERKPREKSPKRAPRVPKEPQEKSTLGDLEVLSSLKTEMEETEKKEPRKPKKELKKEQGTDEPKEEAKEEPKENL